MGHLHCYTSLSGHSTINTYCHAQRQQRPTHTRCEYHSSACHHHDQHCATFFLAIHPFVLPLSLSFFSSVITIVSPSWLVCCCCYFHPALSFSSAWLRRNCALGVIVVAVPFSLLVGVVRLFCRTLDFCCSCLSLCLAFCYRGCHAISLSSLSSSHHYCSVSSSAFH